MTDLPVSHAGLLPEQAQALAALALETNEKLETAALKGSNHAFNLSCSLGLGPGLLIVVLVFALSKANWVIAGGVMALIMLATLGFATLAAYQAKTNTLRRVYQRDVAPEIERTLNSLELTRQSFDQVADETLPPEAILRGYLDIPTPTT